MTTLPALIKVTHDPRFVTARHCLQSLWRIAVASKRARDAVVAALSDRFGGYPGDSNTTLIRADVVEALANVHRIKPDEQLERRTLELSDTEADDKYRTKYLRTWRTHTKHGDSGHEAPQSTRPISTSGSRVIAAAFRGRPRRSPSPASRKQRRRNPR